MLLTSSKNVEIILGSMQPLGGGGEKKRQNQKGFIQKKSEASIFNSPYSCKP